MNTQSVKEYMTQIIQSQPDDFYAGGKRGIVTLWSDMIIQGFMPLL